MSLLALLVTTKIIKGQILATIFTYTLLDYYTTKTSGEWIELHTTRLVLKKIRCKEVDMMLRKEIITKSSDVQTLDLKKDNKQ